MNENVSYVIVHMILLAITFNKVSQTTCHKVSMMWKKLHPLRRSQLQTGCPKPYILSFMGDLRIFSRDNFDYNLIFALYANLEPY